jgi:hypothetical protein
MRYESSILCGAQLELISLNSSEEPLRQFYAAVFPTQKIAATFSFLSELRDFCSNSSPDFPHFLNQW